MTVTKAEIAYSLMDEMGLTRLTSLELVNSLFDTIREMLASGEDVKLSGFGNFTLRDKVAREGRNPKTGEPFEIAARRVVLFKASRKVKERDSNPVAG
ncbi:integration host factor subunit alpha [Acidithiobacillus thiooxidans]|jgi:integration host factor subunit alpha|uniref:Integration host factor subunit alpha n=1 Tax=Acidithiobacillus thiooxidans ATCC 19377 TaxID=637390 RepID=A0A5P9XVW8_ACITH|nr:MULTISPECIES: integration host factor subunit alpha [Acidithiobacillus]MBU2742893.1 integration host factor subunit alpha [Acidithiobacillus albertensis]MBU2835884.1 integration host factor subunit alpha [Acidithiobacillus thiooxidans]MBU2842363.1 integration host factor subunit alpha [Acidithiobacillus thiooxidans]QFX97730.1 integration host factor subunit alpha [Acidithiobacillus thiooxidans ATCC 19377]